jgi:hypothetical protein
MKIKLTLILLISTFILKAQTGNEKDLIICNYNINADTSIHYFTAGFYNVWSGSAGKQDVIFDFGKNIYLDNCEFNGKILRNDEGELRKFYSIVEGLNYFNSKGWKLKSNWVSPNPQAPIYYFLFERKE